MTLKTIFALTATVAVFACSPGRVWASSCGDDVAKLDQRLNKQGASAAAAQGSGQKDAAVRSSKAIEAKKTDTPVADLPKAPTAENLAGTRDAAAASTAGEGVMAAKVSLNDARNADHKGDETGCRKAYEAAKRASGL